MLTLPTAVQKGSRIQSPRGRLLEVTPADALWLARSVEREGEPRTAVAQTMVNRWAWARDFSDRYPRLQDMVRAYSQPVNPRWFPDGDLHRARIAELEQLAAAESDPDRASALRKERDRERARAPKRVEFSEAVEFSPRTLAAVRNAINGPVIIPPGALHFGPSGASSRPVLLDGGPGRNAIYADPRGFGALYAFAVDGPSRIEGKILRHARPHGVIAVVALLSFAGFGLVRRFK